MSLKKENKKKQFNLNNLEQLLLNMENSPVNKDDSVYDQKKIKRSSLLNEFMWICYGANSEILRQCPTEYAKYSGMGGTILFTALMATLSGGYALFSVFENPTIAIIFGVFWGMLIFNLDRFIVNTMYSDGKESISSKEFLFGLPRIIIAIFLGIVISLPLELRIFEKEIKVEITELQNDMIKSSNAHLNHVLDSLSQKREELRIAPIDPTSGIAISSSSQRINNLLQDKNSNMSRWKEWDKKVSFIKNQLNAIDKTDMQSAQLYNSTLENLQKAEFERSRLSQELSRINGELSAEDDQQDQSIANAIKQREKELALLDLLIADTRNKIKINEEIKYGELKQYNGLQAKMIAFNRLKDNNPTTNISAYFIMFLFIIVEVAPTLFKMMIKRGPYDDRLEAENHLQKIKANKIKSDINDEINTSITISTEKNRIKLESELLVNKLIISEIAKVQAEIISAALTSWREEELRKVAENPSLYIKKSFEESSNC